VGVLHKLTTGLASTSSSREDEEISIAGNPDSFDSVIETTQDSIALDHLTLNTGKVSATQIFNVSQIIVLVFKPLHLHF